MRISIAGNREEVFVRASMGRERAQRDRFATLVGCRLESRLFDTHNEVRFAVVLLSGGQRSSLLTAPTCYIPREGPNFETVFEIYFRLTGEATATFVCWRPAEASRPATAVRVLLKARGLAVPGVDAIWWSKSSGSLLENFFNQHDKRATRSLGADR